jgi:type VI secretion system protein ImpK
MDAGHRPGDPALSFQEAFTVGARLRANRQSASDAASFRAHVKALLGSADRDARARGYDPEHVKLAVYAYIAFLDETVLNASQPMFAEWARQPLQEEVFGEHMAGENFFRYLGDLLGRQDSPDLADLLEIYQTCLLLGYRGKYGMSDPTSLQPLMMSVQQKIHRIRGPGGGLYGGWRLPQNEAVPATRDPWVKRLGMVAAAMLVLAIVLWALYTLVLRGGGSEVADLARQLAGDG